MKTKFLKRIYSVFAIVLLALIAVGCSNSEPNTERQAAKEAVESLLSMNFADTDENGVVYDKVKKSIGIVEDGDGIVSEEDLANGSYSEFFGDITATFTSSNPDVMKTEWTYSYRRDFEYAEDGKTVIGIKKVLVRTLNFVVNRQDEDTKVEITMTATKPYEVNGVEYKYTKSRTYLFTVAAKEALGDVVELTIGELNDRIISYAKETSWDNFVKTGLVNENGEKYEVQFQGIVTEVLWNDALDIHSFMVSDGDDSFYVYEPSEITGGGSIEIGDLVVVKCIPTGYYSIIESVKKSAVVEILSHANEVPAAKEYTVDEWYAAFPNGKEFYNCPGQRVKIEGVLQHNGKSYLLKSEDGSKDFEIYYKGYTAYEESLLKANLGKKVKIEASIYDYHSSGYYRLLANIYDYPMEIEVLEGQAGLDADASTITTEFKVKEGGSIKLPTTFPNGSTISAWVADKEGYIDLETLVCTLGETKEDTVVKLTATLSNGEFSKEIIITVTLDYVAPAQKEYVLADKLEVGVAYKYVVNQTNVGKVLYFAGAIDSSGKYFASTEDSNSAVDVYLEAAEGGYYMYFLNEGVKTYMNMASDGSKLCLEAAPSNVWVQNEQYNTFFTTVAETEYYVGMYKEYETFSRSQTSYLANEGQCPARFYVEKEVEVNTSIIDALEAAKGETVTITGVVSNVYNVWSTQYNNMSFYVSDGTNQILVYQIGLNAKIGYEVTVTGVIDEYNGTKQIKKGATGEILSTDLPAGGEMNIEQALKAGLGAIVTVSGKVTEIDSEWSTQFNNMSFYVSDGTNKILVYRSGTQVVVGDLVTVTGSIGTHRGVNQFAQGNTTTVTGHEQPDTPKHEHVACPICTKCTAKDCDGTAEEKCQGHAIVGEVKPQELTFGGAANKADADAYLTSNFPDWTITGKLGQTYGGYLGFGRGDGATGKSAITSNNFAVTKEFVVTAVIKGNGSNSVMTSTLTFELLDKDGNVIATGYANGSTTAAITPVDAKDTTYTIEFTFAEGKTIADAQNLRISFAKATGNIGLKSVSYSDKQAETPKHEHVVCPTCGRCTASDCDGAENEKCQGHQSQPEGEFGVIDNPVAGTAYKFGMVQGNVGKTYYLVGGMDGYYMATTEDAEAALDVYLEAVEGGFYLYVMENGSKKYINMVVSGTHVNGAYEDAASTVYRYDTEAKTLKAEVNGVDYWFGTRNDKTYSTVGPCAVSYNGFYCQFYGEPVHEHKGGQATCSALAKCSVCGEEYGELAEHVDTNLDITCDFEGCTTRILPAGDTKISFFTAQHMIIVSLNSSYYVEGVISEIIDAKNGVFVIKDEAGLEILVRLPKNAEGTAYASWTDLKVCLGDTVQLYGKPTRNTSSTYTQTTKIESGVLTVLKHEHKFSVATCTEPSICECLAINEKALGHIDEDSNKLCDRCQFDLTLVLETIAIATDSNLANGVLSEDETYWTWAGKEVNVVFAKGNSTFTIYKTAKAYMQLKKNNFFTVINNNGSLIKTITIYASNSTQLTNLKNALVGITFVEDAANCSVTIEWNSNENFTFEHKGSTTAYISGVEVLCKPASTEPEVPAHQHVACPECNKCTAEDCDGAEEEKCAGHPVHEHQVCPECQKCLDPECEGEKCEGHVVVEEVKPQDLAFASAANKASADTYLKTNFPDWTITGKLGKTYGGYLGFGRDGDVKSAITSNDFVVTKEFVVTAVIKGNGSKGAMTSTLTFELLDKDGNVIATGYANGSTTAAITPVDTKDTTYTIEFTFAEGKTIADAQNLRISFAKTTGNIGLKSVVFTEK